MLGICVDLPIHHLCIMGRVHADKVLSCIIMADVANVVLSLFPGLFLR